MTGARRYVVVALLLTLAACGGSGGGDSMNTDTSVGSAPVTADVTLLFMGNSHTSYNDLPGMVVAMLQAQLAGRSVAAAVAPGFMFLDERVNDATSMNLLRSQDWSFVVLQAQKYSTSGRFTYSTAEAEQLIRISRERHAVPIMFPEWPRVGIVETQRIYDLHVSIATRQPACVAPVGQAWDLALARNPSLRLHASDGNHSVPAGAFLAALVLSATMSGGSPLDIPPLSQFPVDASTQAFLRGIADEAVRMLPPRILCSADPLP